MTKSYIFKFQDNDQREAFLRWASNSTELDRQLRPSSNRPDVIAQNLTNDELASLKDGPHQFEAYSDLTFDPTDSNL